MCHGWGGGLNIKTNLCCSRNLKRKGDQVDNEYNDDDDDDDYEGLTERQIFKQRDKKRRAFYKVGIFISHQILRPHRLTRGLQLKSNGYVHVFSPFRRALSLATHRQNCLQKKVSFFGFI